MVELSAEEKYEIVLSVGEECQVASELKNLIAKKPSFNLYDGFEPSGRMHIAQGVFKAMNVNKCTRAGGIFIFWVADWFALMNDKMGGDLDKIKTVGKYLIEVWKAAGMDMERVRFVWASDGITTHADTYWPKMLDICNDIFHLKADVCQLGVDQRKVNALAREYCDHAGIKLKPIILSHHMLYGLKQGQEKMSKSDPDSAIFMEDSCEDVARKINAAYCPMQEEKPAPSNLDFPTSDGVEAGAWRPDGQGCGTHIPPGWTPSQSSSALDDSDSMHLKKDLLKNPCLDYVENILFSKPDASFKAGATVYDTFAAVRAAALNGQMTEGELKAGLIDAINELLEPVRAHFAKEGEPKEVFELVKQYKKEVMVPPKGVKHLKALQETKPVWAVFASMPTLPYTSLGEMLTVLKQLKAGLAAEHAVVLWIADWSAIAHGCMNGDIKSIRASFTVLLASLQALAPEVMCNVKVMMQSEAILTNPSDYWISVINVGRHFDLNDIAESVDPSNEGAGKIIATLMHVADVMGCGASVVCHSPSAQPLHSVAVRYYEAVGVDCLPLPKLVCVPAVSTVLKEKTGGGFDADADYWLLDNPAADATRKMKRAFCEPGNVDFNAPLTLAAELAIELEGSLVVKRKPANGGDKEYTSVDALTADFTSEALHPGDLKASVGAKVVDVLTKIQGEFKQNKDAKKADADVKAFIKKMSKKK
ncbi:hypothetical protein CYMTET_20572 [Cymbomonas tetramitiformis]|uniref:tyrosine--tRNA ligase n=1 Tax=Cymbomonas tetramitiformis TaxID=36881 RepID=A0AAE0G3W6_9CHLO|nr:hypothetical protein CYMTET_20572 [Cymbomonas tetramitiformis]